MTGIESISNFVEVPETRLTAEKAGESEMRLEVILQSPTTSVLESFSNGNDVSSLLKENSEDVSGLLLSAIDALFSRYGEVPAASSDEGGRIGALDGVDLQRHISGEENAVVPSVEEAMLSQIEARSGGEFTSETLAMDSMPAILGIGGEPMASPAPQISTEIFPEPMRYLNEGMDGISREGSPHFSPTLAELIENGYRVLDGMILPPPDRELESAIDYSDAIAAEGLKTEQNQLQSLREIGANEVMIDAIERAAEDLDSALERLFDERELTLADEASKFGGDMMKSHRKSKQQDLAAILSAMLTLKGMLHLSDDKELDRVKWKGGLAHAPIDPAVDARARQKTPRLLDLRDRYNDIREHMSRIRDANQEGDDHEMARQPQQHQQFMRSRAGNIGRRRRSDAFSSANAFTENAADGETSPRLRRRESRDEGKTG